MATTKFSDQSSYVQVRMHRYSREICVAGHRNLLKDGGVRGRNAQNQLVP